MPEQWVGLALIVGVAVWAAAAWAWWAWRERRGQPRESGGDDAGLAGRPHLIVPAAAVPLADCSCPACCHRRRVERATLETWYGAT